MANRILPAVPFDEEWLDCVQNNLISVLMTADERFRNTPCAAARRYGMYLPPEGGSTLAERRMPRILEDGDMILQVKNIDNFSHMFVKKDVPVSPGVPIADVLIDRLNRGEYLFVYVDRYYYPSGNDAGRNHLLHPAFVHGYDTDKQVFHLIEDCVNVGKMERYELPFDDLRRACFAANANHVTTVRLRDDIPVSWDRYFGERLVRDNLELLLKEETELNDVIWKNQRALLDEKGLRLRYGLSCIGIYAERIGSLLPPMSNRRLERLKVDLRMPHLFRKATVGLPRLLREATNVPDERIEHLAAQYEAMAERWGIVTSKILLYIGKRASGGTIRQGYFDGLGRLLEELLELERESAYSILESL